jgi:hypothetical protein
MVTRTHLNVTSIVHCLSLKTVSTFISTTLWYFRYPLCASFNFKGEECQEVMENVNFKFIFTLSSTHISEVQSGRKLHTNVAHLREAQYTKIHLGYLVMTAD